MFKLVCSTVVSVCIRMAKSERASSLTLGQKLRLNKERKSEMRKRANKRRRAVMERSQAPAPPTMDEEFEEENTEEIAAQRVRLNSEVSRGFEL